jgi:hypothetical protein
MNWKTVWKKSAMVFSTIPEFARSAWEKAWTACQDSLCSYRYLVKQSSSILFTRRHIRGYTKTSYMNQNETRVSLESWTSSDPHIYEDSSPSLGSGMLETSSVISLTGQNHVNNWSNIYSYNFALLKYFFPFINFCMILLNTLFFM